MARCIYLAAALLLVARVFADIPDNLEFPFELAEPPCSAVTPELLETFVVGGSRDNSTLVTKAQAVLLGCQMTLLLQRGDAGNATAAGRLRTMYAAWRRAYRTQEWRVPRASWDNWMASLRTIAEINQRLDGRFWTALNAYSDMSVAEFAAAVLMNTTAPPTLPTANATSKSSRKLLARGTGTPKPSYPLVIDWVSAGKVLPSVGFQASCGSSWAFATAAALESKLMIGAGLNSTAVLSAQYIMDCTASLFSYATSACSGGSLTDALQFAADRGVTADAAYRYRALHGGQDVTSAGRLAQCDRDFLAGQAAKAGSVRITGTPAYTRVASTQLAVIQALASQPAVALLSVDATFQHYAGGVWSSTACNPAAPNHALLLVGYNAMTAGQEHFSVKNSLGVSWGERGFGRIAMTTDANGMCGLYRSAYQPGTVTQVAPTKPGNGPIQAAVKAVKAVLAGNEKAV